MPRLQSFVGSKLCQYVQAEAVLELGCCFLSTCSIRHYRTFIHPVKTLFPSHPPWFLNRIDDRISLLSFYYEINESYRTRTPELTSYIYKNLMKKLVLKNFHHIQYQNPSNDYMSSGALASASNSLILQEEGGRAQLAF